MNPGKLEGANLSLGAPENWNAEKFGECVALPVLDNGVTLQSIWIPDAEELAALNAGQPVLLTIYGRNHPAIAVGVLAAVQPS